MKSVAQIISVFIETDEGRKKGSWEPHAALKTVVENH